MNTSSTPFIDRVRRQWATWMDWLIESQPLTPPASHGHLRRRLAPLHAALQARHRLDHRSH